MDENKRNGALKENKKVLKFRSKKPINYIVFYF